MKYLDKLRYFIFFMVISNLLLITAFVPTVIRIFRTPKTALYPYLSQMDLTNNLQYLSAVVQGQNGSWVYNDPYTIETTAPGYFFSFYIIVGKLASFFGILTYTALLLSRIILGELYCIALYFFSVIFLG